MNRFGIASTEPGAKRSKSARLWQAVNLRLPRTLADQMKRWQRIQNARKQRQLAPYHELPVPVPWGFREAIVWITCSKDWNWVAAS
jgi:hypothetical protein